VGFAGAGPWASGQRTTDIVALVQSLGRAYPNARIGLAARNRLTVPALCAASLEPAIASTYLCGGIPSWRSLLDSEQYAEPFANFVSGVLAITDLPQIAKSIAPRSVIAAPESSWTAADLAEAARL
jgi:hypothetical protein